MRQAACRDFPARRRLNVRTMSSAVQGRNERHIVAVLQLIFELPIQFPVSIVDEHKNPWSPAQHGSDIIAGTGSPTASVGSPTASVGLLFADDASQSLIQITHTVSPETKSSGRSVRRLSCIHRISCLMFATSAGTSTRCSLIFPNNSSSPPLQPEQ